MTATPHLFAGQVIPPLLRPLPALFFCAEHSSTLREESLPEELSEIYLSHRECLAALLEGAASLAALAPSDWATLAKRIQALPDKLSPALPAHLETVDLELARFSEVHRAVLRQAYNMHPEVFRNIYRTHLTPWKVAVVYSDPEDEQVPRLLETLSERCYYDTRSAGDAHVTLVARWADLVLFAPRPEPLSAETVAVVRRLQKPFLVLINLGADIAQVEMEQVRLAALYQRNQIPTLHRPFPGIRLFQRIDRELLEHRLRLLLAQRQPARTNS